MKRFIIIMIFFIPWMQAVGLSQADEHFLQAVFIGKISNYIEWPATKELSEDYFEIAVFGDDPLAEEIQNVYKKFKIKDLPVRVKKVTQISEIGNPHVIYLPKSANLEFENIRSYIESKPVLTLSDIKSGFAERGSILEFYIKNDKLRLMFNAEALSRSGLQIKPRLINILKVVDPKEQ